MLYRFKHDSRWVSVAFLLLLAAAGCASPAKAPQQENPKKSTDSSATSPKANPLPSRCAGFCDQIHVAARQHGHAELGDLLCIIARCETGDRCRASIDSKSRRYRGAFQFSPATWRQLCRPYFARAEMESCKPYKAMHDLDCATACSAEIIAASSDGLRNWPACSRKASEAENGESDDAASE